MLLTLAVVLGLWLLWMVISGFLGFRSAQAMEDTADELVENIKSGNTESVYELLPQMREQAASASARFNSAPWSVMSDLPLMGPTVRLLGDVSAGTSAMVAATQGHDGEIVAATTRLTNDGVSGIGALSALAPVADAAASAVEPYEQRVSQTLPDELLPGPFESVQERFLGLASGARAASGATRALPVMLGAEGTRRWAVIVENTAEARGTGGLIGAYATVTLQQGRFLDPSASDTNALFKNETIPLDGIPKDTRDFWGDSLSRWWGLNLDRNFPFAGELVHRGLADVGTQVDDVVSLDSFAVAGLLEATGPIKVKGYEVTPENAAAFFTRDIYEAFPDRDAKDAITVALMDQLLTRVARSQLDLPDLWDALGPAAEQGSLLTYSNDPEVQENLLKMPTSGAVPPDVAAWSTVGINDLAGNKLSAYLDVEMIYDSAARCEASSAVTVTVTNNAPEGLPEYVDQRNDDQGGPLGSTLVGVAVYGPPGSVLERYELDDEQVPLNAGVNSNHPTWMARMDLKRGDSQTFRVVFTEPTSYNRPTITAQPMTNPATAVARSSC